MMKCREATRIEEDGAEDWGGMIDAIARRRT